MVNSAVGNTSVLRETDCVYFSVQGEVGRRWEGMKRGRERDRAGSCFGHGLTAEPSLKEKRMGDGERRSFWQGNNSWCRVQVPPHGHQAPFRAHQAQLQRSVGFAQRSEASKSKSKSLAPIDKRGDEYRLARTTRLIKRQKNERPCRMPRIETREEICWSFAPSWSSPRANT